MNSKSQVNPQNRLKFRNKNRYFYQFNTRITPFVLYKLAEHPLALKIFAVIMQCSGKLGVVALQQKYIQKFLSRKRSSISEAIRYLKKIGIITVTKIDTRNVYVMNPTLIWQESYNKRNYVHNNFRFNDPYAIRDNKSLADKFNKLKRLSYPVPYEKFYYIQNKKKQNKKDR